MKLFGSPFAAASILCLVLAAQAPAQAIRELLWEEIQGLPAGMSNGGAAAAGGTLFHIGGRSGARRPGESSVFRFDPKLRKWQMKTPMPTGRLNLAVACVRDKIYVIGGDAFSDKNEMYDPATDAWRTMAPMPTGRQHVGCAAVGGKIYVFGGLTGGTAVSDKNEAYDTATDTWATRKPMPTPRHQAAVAALGGTIYVIGGMVDDGGNIWKEVGTVEAYDPRTDSWRSLKSLPDPWASNAFALDGRVYAVGGCSQDKGFSRVDEYDPATNAWTQVASIPVPLIAAGVAELGGAIYMIGGHDCAAKAQTFVYRGTIKK